MDIITKVFIYIMDLLKIKICNKYLFDGKMTYLWIPYIAGGILFYTLFYLSNNDSLGYVVTYIITIIVAVMTINDDYKNRIIKIVWIYCVSSSIDDLINSILNNFIDSKEMRYMLSVTFSTLLILLGSKTYVSMKKNGKNIKKTFNIIYAVIIFTCLALHIVTAINQYIMYIEEGSKANNILKFSTSFAYLGISLLLTLAFISQRIFEYIERVKDTEQRLKYYQRLYYQQLLNEEEETRRYRHDMKNHLITLKEFARNEKAFKTELYIDNIANRIMQISQNRYETGNLTFNILLNYYIKEIPEVKILVCGKFYRELQINEVEQSIIFGNILQNAVESLKNNYNKNKHLKIKLKQGSNITQIIIKNTSDKKLEKTYKILKTDKKEKENHGFGLRNVTNILEKYEGTMVFKGDGQEFQVFIQFVG